MDTIGKPQMLMRRTYKAPARAVLKHRLGELMDELESERQAQQKAAEATSHVRQKMSELQRLADDLLAARASHDEFVKVKEARFLDRTAPLEGASLIQRLGAHDASDAKLKPPGQVHHRSARRTAYTRDYAGTPILGPCEFVETWNRQQRVDERTRQQQQQRAASSTLPPLSPTTDMPDHISSTKQRLTPSFIDKKLPAGAISLQPDLEQFKRRSTRRTRFYIDYEGRRMAMDPCDWPSQDGFVLADRSSGPIGAVATSKRRGNFGQASEGAGDGGATE